MGSFCVNALRQVLQKFCTIMQRSWYGKRAVGPIAFTNAKPQLTLGYCEQCFSNEKASIIITPSIPGSLSVHWIPSLLKALQ